MSDQIALDALLKLLPDQYIEQISNLDMDALIPNDLIDDLMLSHENFYQKELFQDSTLESKKEDLFNKVDGFLFELTSHTQQVRNDTAMKLPPKYAHLKSSLEKRANDIKIKYMSLLEEAQKQGLSF